MRFAFFESLTHQEAQTLLRRFCEVEREAIMADPALFRQTASEGQLFSLDRLPAIFARCAADLSLVSVPTPPDLPDWILSSLPHKDGFFEFAPSSAATVLRVAYYMGECFVQLPTLSWGIGKENTAIQNQPVVTGFENGLELSPLLVSENIFRRILDGADASIETSKTMDFWVGKIPDAK